VRIIEGFVAGGAEEPKYWGDKPLRIHNIRAYDLNRLFSM